MDKKIILAVAGSGKSTYLINQLDLHRRVMFVTYTTSNLENLRVRIIKKFGYFPNNITLLPYFTFLHSFCFRPFLASRLKTKGLTFENPPLFPRNPTKRSYYIANEKIYSNRLAKAIEMGGVAINVTERIEKYFDCLFIDEVQDIAGNDFNFLKALTKAKVNILFVGDFYQHTFDTSRDGNINKSLFDNYLKYKEHFEKMGLVVDTTTLDKSYRCSPTVCSYITENIRIKIESHRSDETIIHLIENREKAAEILNNNEIVKLFYKEHYKYRCNSRNWGACKGEDRFGNICVVLNKTTQRLFTADKLHELNVQTLNKFYVACSRARNNLYFVFENLLTQT